MQLSTPNLESLPGGFNLRRDRRMHSLPHGRGAPDPEHRPFPFGWWIGGPVAKSDLDALLERARNRPTDAVSAALDRLPPADRDKLRGALVAKVSTSPTRWAYVGTELARILAELTGDDVTRRDVENYRRRHG
jgi:hypothetical protein